LGYRYWTKEILENIVKKLGFDYINYKLDWEEFRDLQLSFLKASVPEIETPTDIAILAVNHMIASQNNIKYIISGGNYVTEGILPKSWHYDVKDYKYIKSIHKQYGTKDLNNLPIFDYKKEMYYKFVKGIRMIYILNYIKYNPNEVLETLQKNLIGNIIIGNIMNRYIRNLFKNIFYLQSLI